MIEGIQTLRPAQIGPGGRQVNDGDATISRKSTLGTLPAPAMQGRVCQRMAPFPSDPTPSARALLQERDYLFFWTTRCITGMATQIQSVALGWQVYTLSRQTQSVQQSALMVGMIGLATFIPVFLLTLPAGDTADRYDRRRILSCALLGEMASVAILAVASWRHAASPALLLGAAFLFGASRAFFNPANTALGPMLVPRALLPRAIAWNSLATQTASIVGPALGGVLIAYSTTHAYVTVFCLYLGSSIAVAMIRKNGRAVANPGSRWSLMLEGLAYVWREKIIFGAISLDLFAVLLGGATALLPVFARDVLHVGSEGFGLLRASPAVGGVAMALFVAARPVRRRAGLVMFLAVGAFGLGTCVFAASRSLWLSAVALAIVGSADVLNVFIRATLVQIVTPDAMRGRVSAVSSVFIGASNELGEFESGVLARFLGPVMAAMFGGLGAIAVTGLWAWIFPALRRADRLE